MSWICLYRWSSSACRHHSVRAAKEFILFVVRLLEGRLLYHIISHLTLISGTSNKHGHKYVSVFELPTDDGRARVFVLTAVRGLCVLVFVRVSEGCVFCCGQDMLRDVWCHGITLTTCIYREKANYWGYSFVVGSAARSVCGVRYS
jgi:hypothetical protein